MCPQLALTPLAVIVGFDVFKHGFTHLAAAYEALAVDAFDFQGVEEALRTRIVVAVALRVHAELQVMTADQILISRRAVLAVAVALYYYSVGLHT